MSSQRRPTAASPGQRTSGPGLMITRDPGVAGRARVIGSLTADTVHILLDAVGSGVSVLDLAEVVEIDDFAAHVLTRLRAERCSLLACPRWLELWLARVPGEADE